MEEATNRNDTTISEAEEQIQKILSFHIGSEEYGIDIGYVTEIVGLQKITDLPDLPDYIRGVINLRGKVIPVIDVRLRFNFEERAYDERTCIIVTQINELQVGLIVDSVSEVLDLPADKTEPSPRIQKGSESRYVQCLGKFGDSVKIVLNIKKLLFDENLNNFTEQEELAA